MARGWGIVGAVTRRRAFPGPAKEAPRDRILFDGKVLVGPDPTVNELGALVRRFRPSRRRFRSAADPARASSDPHLGFRALETCSLEWRAVNLTMRRPRSPSRPRRRALGFGRCRCRRRPSGTAGAERRGREGRGYLFPAEAGAKRATHLHPESLSRAFARACARLGIAGASTHDLRRTCLSGLMELGHETVAERIAGHVPRHVLGRHYDRSSRLDAMRAGLEEWAKAIEAARERASPTPADAETAQHRAVS